MGAKPVYGTSSESGRKSPLGSKTYAYQQRRAREGSPYQPVSVSKKVSVLSSESTHEGSAITNSDVDTSCERDIKIPGWVRQAGVQQLQGGKVMHEPSHSLAQNGDVAARASLHDLASRTQHAGRARPHAHARGAPHRPAHYAPQMSAHEQVPTNPRFHDLVHVRRGYAAAHQHRAVDPRSARAYCSPRLMSGSENVDMLKKKSWLSWSLKFEISKNKIIWFID